MSDRSNSCTVKPLISICACTYHRPELLRCMITSLALQNLAESFEIVIVDNDASGSAQQIVEQARQEWSRLSLHYVIEPRQGISYARNRCVAEARGEYIAFIDDDEEACQDWLLELLSVLRDANAEAAFGPVLPVFPEGSPSWTVRSGLFDRPRFSNGYAIQSGDARTGNALVKRAWFNRDGGPPFRPEFAHSGGEDLDFFRWMEARGARFAWANLATVSEVVPIERQSLDFVLERRLRASAGYWRGIQQPPLRRLLHALFGTGAGLALMLAGLGVWFIDKAIGARLLAKGVNGCGRLLALTEIRLQGYGGRNV